MYLTIPSAHDLNCAARAPYARFGAMSQAELRALLPAMAKAGMDAATAHAKEPTAERRAAMLDALRASRACSDALSLFAPRRARPTQAARAYRSWR